MAITDRRGAAVDEGESASDMQEVTTGTATTELGISTIAINRTAPSTTGITLPNASLRGGRQLRIVDFSQSVTEHTITLTPQSVAQKIMRQATWTMLSNPSNLSSVTLRPIVDPDDSTNYVWVIAP